MKELATLTFVMLMALQNIYPFWIFVLLVFIRETSVVSQIFKKEIQNESSSSFSPSRIEFQQQVLSYAFDKKLDPIINYNGKGTLTLFNDLGDDGLKPISELVIPDDEPNSKTWNIAIELMYKRIDQFIEDFKKEEISEN